MNWSARPFKKVTALNINGAVVNTGVDHGVGALMKLSPWLQVIHCCRSYTIDLSSQ